MMIGVNGVRLSGGSLGLSSLGGLSTSTSQVEQIKKSNSRATSFDSSSKANVPGKQMALELEDIVILLLQ